MRHVTCCTITVWTHTSGGGKLVRSQTQRGIYRDDKEKGLNKLKKKEEVTDMSLMLNLRAGRKVVVSYF